jgi:competence protein ComEC
LHLGILAGALFWLLRQTPLPRGWAAALVAAATVFYMFLVDAGPPVVRATVLVLVACAAAYWGRRPLGFNSLAAAALVVLAINPSHLFHTGAQLSFLSVAGLMWFAPRWMTTDRDRRTLERLIAANLAWPSRMFWAVRRSVWHLMLVSLTIWLLTMPLVMARFHLCTPIAVLLNIVAWLPMAGGLIGGAVLMLVGPIAPPLAHLCGAFCNWNFRLLEWCVSAARCVPLSHFWVPGPADWWLFGFYGGLGLLAAFPRLRPPRRWCAALVALWIAVGLIVSMWPRHRDRVDCTFVSMGHGCAALVQFPSGQSLLYDAGQSGAPSAGVRTISEFLWDRGLTHLDAVVVSHPDLDHFNALPGLMERFSIGEVCVSPLMFQKRTHTVHVLQRAINAHGIPVHEIWAGNRLWAGPECSVEVLHPLRHGTLGPDNANSIVLAIDYLGREILLPGDLESPVNLAQPL